MAIQKRVKQQKSRKRGGFWASEAGKKTFVILLMVIAFAGLLAVIVSFRQNPGAQNGVGADGFSVYEIKGADLGVASVVRKPDVETELSTLVSQVDDAKKSGVISYNGNKGQTSTFYITTKDGAEGSFYVDVMQYKSQKAFEDANVYRNTLDAGRVQGNAARYMHAATIANEREYALLVIKGLNSYKFALTQPFKNVKINEVTALGAMKRIAEKADLQ